MVCTGPLEAGCPPGIDIRIVTTAGAVSDFAAVTGAAYATYGMPVETAAQLLSLPTASWPPPTWWPWWLTTATSRWPRP